MLFAIATISGDRPEVRAELMAERLIERRAAHAFPSIWVAMFRPVEILPGADLVLAVHYQTKSIQELQRGDWFTAREVKGFDQEAGWTSYRKLNSHRLDGMFIGPSSFTCEG